MNRPKLSNRSSATSEEWDEDTMNANYEESLSYLKSALPITAGGGEGISEGQLRRGKSKRQSSLISKVKGALRIPSLSRKGKSQMGDAYLNEKQVVAPESKALSFYDDAKVVKVSTDTPKAATRPRAKSDKYLKFLESYEEPVYHEYESKETKTLDKYEKQRGYKDASRPPPKPSKPAKKYNNNSNNWNSRNDSFKQSGSIGKVKSQSNWRQDDPKQESWAARTGKPSESTGSTLHRAWGSNDKGTTRTNSTAGQSSKSLWKPESGRSQGFGSGWGTMGKNIGNGKQTLSKRSNTSLTRNYKVQSGAKGHGGAAKRNVGGATKPRQSRNNTGATRPRNTGPGNNRTASTYGRTSSTYGAAIKKPQRPTQTNQKQNNKGGSPYSQSTLKKTQKNMNGTRHSPRDGMKKNQSTLTRPGRSSGPGSARNRRLTPNAHGSTKSLRSPSAPQAKLKPSTSQRSMRGGQGTLTRPGSKGTMKGSGTRGRSPKRSGREEKAKAKVQKTGRSSSQNPPTQRTRNDKQASTHSKKAPARSRSNAPKERKVEKKKSKAPPRQRTNTVTSTASATKKAMIDMWDNKFEENKARQESNPFAAGFKDTVRLRPGDPGYGVPVGKTAERGIKAKMEMEQGMEKLLKHIKGMGHKDSQGYYVTFGELFLEYEQISSNLVYYLQLGKKRKYLTYEDLPGTLFQGKHDHVVIRLLK